MYSSIYRVQSSTRRLPIRALFGFTLKLVESYFLPLSSESLVWWFVLGSALGRLTAAVAANPAPSPPCSITRMAGDTDPNLLLPRSVAPGPCLTLQQFCSEYSLSDAVYHKLNENGYTSSNTISYIRVSELKEMGFKHGEIAAMKDVVRQWISSA